MKSGVTTSFFRAALREDPGLSNPFDAVLLVPLVVPALLTRETPVEVASREDNLEDAALLPFEGFCEGWSEREER